MADDPDKKTTEASDPTPPAKRRKPKRLQVVLIVLIIGIVLGVAAWIALSGFIGTTSATTTPPSTVQNGTEARPNDIELDIGRITVALADDPTGTASNTADKSGHHLLIQATVVLDGVMAKDRPDVQDVARYRDLFIEYLSQLDLEQVRGSAGFARVRGELLRRAQVVTGDTTAKMVLIQDYMAQ